MWLCISIPIIFILLGTLAWAVSTNPTVKGTGLLAAQAGWIGLVFALSGHYFPHR